MRFLTNGHIRALWLFNKKAERLLKSRFADFVREKKQFRVVYDIKKEKPIVILKELPDKHAIDEFVLTFRFFIQDNEDSSFRMMAKLYENLPISKELKTQFVELRENLNDYLDSEPSIKFKINDQIPTCRTIMNVFIYGKLAHADKKLGKIFDEWASNRVMFPLLEFEFNTIINNIFRIIQFTQGINDKAIEELRSTEASP